MLYNIDDFKLIRNEKNNGHDDYWFAVSGEAQKYIEEKTWEMCMVGVEEVVYSKDEGLVGIKRIFPFNWDVVLSKDIDLKYALETLTANR